MNSCIGIWYCNSVLAGVSRQLQDLLQSVLNAAARLVFFGEAVIRTHNSIAPEVTLVKSPRVDQISPVRSGIPLSSWDGAILPR